MIANRKSATPIKQNITRISESVQGIVSDRGGGSSLRPRARTQNLKGRAAIVQNAATINQARNSKKIS